MKSENFHIQNDIKNVKWKMFSFLSELNEALNQSRLIRDDYIAF
jgi:hypothetical protein